MASTSGLKSAIIVVSFQSQWLVVSESLPGFTIAFLKSLFEKYICRVRTAHQPLKAPEGRQVYRYTETPAHLSPSGATGI